ncbi:aminopeptidase P family protein [Candidatus Woesearchaeota archaeon]|nr:aminopeptidase P family protein [Candidatus Woesearchaeota archaeon]
MKLKEFQDYLNNEDIDYALFFSNSADKIDHNFLYFSNFDTGILLISKNDIILFTSEMEHKRAEKESIIRNIMVKEDPFDYINKLKAKKIGLNYDRISLISKSKINKHIKNVKFADVSKKCDELRLTKTEKEIDYLKKSCKFIDKIFNEIINNFNFKTEIKLANKMYSIMRDYGLEESFSPIVASSKNSGMAHHTISKDRIKKGFLVLDFGVKYKNYCSDLTRTLYVGKPTKKEIEDYNLLLDSQLKAINMIKINNKVAEVDKIIRNDLGKKFLHSLGHGIGLRIHEAPSISYKSEETFKENMVFTIEPGIYDNKYGIRIEDDILLNKNNIKILTKTTKELIRI